MGDARFVFEARTIQRMELLVLSTLKWRMQAVTPFSFIDYFLTKINGGDQIASSSSIVKCIELILSTLQGKFVKCMYGLNLCLCMVINRLCYLPCLTLTNSRGINEN